MLLQKENNPHLNTVTAYGDDYVEINRVKHHASIYFRPEGTVHELSVKKAADVDAALLRDITGISHIKQDPMAFLNDEPIQLPTDAPEVLLIGTGTTQQFLSPSALSELLGLGIGVEVMDTPAAARTYNILMSEGRKVVVALLL